MATGDECDFRVLVSAGSLFGMCPVLALWPGNAGAPQLFEQPALHAPSVSRYAFLGGRCGEVLWLKWLSSLVILQRGSLPWGAPVCRGLSPWAASACCDASSAGATLCTRCLRTTVWVPSISADREKAQGRRVKAQVFSCCTLRPFCQEFAVLLLVKGIVFFLPLLTDFCKVVCCSLPISYILLCTPIKVPLRKNSANLGFFDPASSYQPARSLVWGGTAPPSLLLSTFGCSSASLPAVYSKDSSQL